MKSQKTVRDAVKRLEGPASKEVIEEATICHLRPMRLPLNKYVTTIQGLLHLTYNTLQYISLLCICSKAAS